MLQETRVNKNSKILIVDDSRIVVSLHSSILKSAGFDCDTAENGAEALEKIILKQYSLILTDLNMPKMDGYELTRKLRKIENYGSVPVIMISTEQEPHDEVKGIEAGANLYIAKPIQPNELIANVMMLLPIRG